MQEKIFKISGFTAKAMYRLEAEVEHRGRTKCNEHRSKLSGWLADGSTISLGTFSARRASSTLTV